MARSDGRHEAILPVIQDDARCDRCPSARALVMVTRGPLSLELCKSHYERNAAEFYANGWSVVVDLRPSLVADEDARMKGGDN